MNAMHQLVQRSFLAAALLTATFTVGCKEDPVDQPEPIAVVYTDPVSTSEADSVRAMIQQHESDTNLIPTSQAADTAQMAYPGGSIVGINLNYDSDTLVYECVVRQDKKYYIVIINPLTGRIVRTGTTDSAYYAEIVVPRMLVIDIRSILRQVRGLLPRAVTVECNVEQIENRPTYVVIMLDRDNRYAILFIDAQTGKERRLEFNGLCRDDRHKDKKGRGHYRHGRGRGYGHYYHCHCDCDD